MSSDDASPTLATLSTTQRVLMISLVMWVLFVISGPITGPQAIFGALASRGVYRNQCDFSNTTATTCQAQEQAIESATVLCLSICNFLCVAWGFAQDTLGPRKVAVIGVTVWTIAKSGAGFYPDNGIMWTVCESIAASASLGAYSAIGLEHLRQACVTDGLYAVMGFISSAAWDIAVILNLALAKLYGLEAITLWQAYMIYGLGAGVPVLAGLALWPKKHADEETQTTGTPKDSPTGTSGGKAGASDDYLAESDKTLSTIDGSPHSPNANSRSADFEASNVSLKETSMADDAKAAMKKTVTDVKTIFSTAIFWIFAAHCSVVVTVGYFMIANVGSLATSHGMHDRSAARDITTVMMSAIGVTSIVPGRILYALGTQRGLVVLMAIQAVLLIVFGALIAFGDETTFYVSFGLMFIWRVWGFGMTFPFIDWRFKHCPNGVGVCYGGVFALGGAVSMAAGSAASHSLHSDPQASLKPVMLTLCGVSVFIELIFGFLIARVDPSNVAGVEVDESTAGLINDREA